MPLIVNCIDCILVGNGCLSVLLDSLLDCVMCVRSAMMLALRQRSRPAAPGLFRRPARLIFAATGIGGFTYYSSAECTPGGRAVRTREQGEAWGELYIHNRVRRVLLNADRHGR